MGIGEVARAVGCSPSLLRLMEAEGAIPAPERLHDSGARVYRPQDVKMILAARTVRATISRRGT
ncbi:MAG: MerR family transcriptional regulator [Solirubrobacteraceae bacterium]